MKPSVFLAAAAVLAVTYCSVSSYQVTGTSDAMELMLAPCDRVQEECYPGFMCVA